MFGDRQQFGLVGACPFSGIDAFALTGCPIELCRAVPYGIGVVQQPAGRAAGEQRQNVRVL